MKIIVSCIAKNTEDIGKDLRILWKESDRLMMRHPVILPRRVLLWFIVDLKNSCGSLRRDKKREDWWSVDIRGHFIENLALFSSSWVKETRWIFGWRIIHPCHNYSTWIGLEIRSFSGYWWRLLWEKWEQWKNGSKKVFRRKLCFLSSTTSKMQPSLRYRPINDFWVSQRFAL